MEEFATTGLRWAVLWRSFSQLFFGVEACMPTYLVSTWQSFQAWQGPECHLVQPFVSGRCPGFVADVDDVVCTLPSPIWP